MYKEFRVEKGRTDHWATYPAPERIDVVREPMTSDGNQNEVLAAIANPQTPKESVNSVLFFSDRWNDFHNRRNQQVGVWGGRALGMESADREGAVFTDFDFDLVQDAISFEGELANPGLFGLVEWQNKTTFFEGPDARVKGFLSYDRAVNWWDIDMSIQPEVVEFAGFVNYGRRFDNTTIVSGISSDASLDRWGSGFAGGGGSVARGSWGGTLIQGRKGVVRNAGQPQNAVPRHPVMVPSSVRFSQHPNTASIASGFGFSDATMVDWFNQQRESGVLDDEVIEEIRDEIAVTYERQAILDKFQAPLSMRPQILMQPFHGFWYPAEQVEAAVVMLAPGFHSTVQDVRDLLVDFRNRNELEESEHDARALELLASARSKLMVEHIVFEGDADGYTISPDGRFLRKQRTPHFLDEFVASDGSHLMHYYPEFGMVAKLKLKG